MHHHGKGVYTGTFSGTLNPALQDRHGRPKRDISTIIHILNDLLCATPATTAGNFRYHRHTGSSHQRASSSSASTMTAAAGPQAASMFAMAPSEHPAMSGVPVDSLASNLNSPNPALYASGNFFPPFFYKYSYYNSHYLNTDVNNYLTEELSKENEATKGKMKKLRLVMEQRREKMRARRQARASPYTTKWAAVTPDPNAASASPTTTSSGGGKSSSDPQNEPELQPCSPEPVVA